MCRGPLPTMCTNKHQGVLSSVFWAGAQREKHTSKMKPVMKSHSRKSPCMGIVWEGAIGNQVSLVLGQHCGKKIR